MTQTSDERREVAARLRQIADAHGAVEASRVAHALGLEYEVHGTVVAFGSDAVQALADLIDPTCTFDQLESDDIDVITCSKCGMKFNEHDDKSADIYRFCPNCGARVAE